MPPGIGYPRRKRQGGLIPGPGTVSLMEIFGETPNPANIGIFDEMASPAGPTTASSFSTPPTPDFNDLPDPPLVDPPGGGGGGGGGGDDEESFFFLDPRADLIDMVSQLKGSPVDRLGGILGRVAERPQVRNMFFADAEPGSNITRNVSPDDLRQMLDAGIFQGATARRFLERILSGPVGGGGGGGGNGGDGGGGGGVDAVDPSGGGTTFPPGTVTPPTMTPPATTTPPANDPNDALDDIVDLEPPAAGGPTFGQSGAEGEDELSTLINERLAALVSGEGQDAQFGGSLLDAGEQGLIDLIQGGGYNPDILEMATRQAKDKQAQLINPALESMRDVLAERRLTGGGTEVEATQDLFDNLTSQGLQDIREVTMAELSRAGDRSSGAAESAVSGGLARRGQDIAQFQQSLQNQLDSIQTATGRALGVGDLALRNMMFNADVASMLAQDQLATSQYLEAVKQQREGNTQGALQLILRLLNQLQAGATTSETL